MEKIISEKQLLNDLRYERYPIGYALSKVIRIVCTVDAERSFNSAIKYAAVLIGYQIAYFDNMDTDELSMLLFQKLADTNNLLAEKFDCIGWITSLYRPIVDYLIEIETSVDELVKDLSIIEDYYYSKGLNTPDLRDMIDRLKKIPFRRLRAFRRIMKDYMFKVDSELFGLQANDSNTVGFHIDEQTAGLAPDFKEYDYIAFINRSLSGGPCSSASIATGFHISESCDNCVVRVDFKVYRDRCGIGGTKTFGNFIADFDHIFIDFNNIEKSQDMIVEELNYDMEKLLSFVEGHPNIDSSIKNDGVVVRYGKI